MPLDAAAVLRNSWAVWRRDRLVLAPVSGLTFFLPQWAVLLLIPPAPDMGARGKEAVAAEAWGQAMSGWFAAHGLFLLLAALIAQFGMLAVAVLYLRAPGVTVSGGLLGALRLLPRLILATLLVALPLGLVVLIGLLAPGGLVIALAPIFYVLGRACLTGPVLAAERATSAAGAVARSFALSRGYGLVLALLVGGITLTGQIASALLLGLDQMLKDAGAPNPVVLALIDAVAAGATWASMLCLALVQVVLYRRLTSERPR